MLRGGREPAAEDVGVGGGVRAFGAAASSPPPASEQRACPPRLACALQSARTAGACVDAGATCCRGSAQAGGQQALSAGSLAGRLAPAACVRGGAGGAAGDLICQSLRHSRRALAAQDGHGWHRAIAADRRAPVLAKGPPDGRCPLRARVVGARLACAIIQFSKSFRTRRLTSRPLIPKT